MADSWQMAIICYLCGMKQIEATPILDIVSRIIALEADMDNVAYDQSVNFILDGITCYNKEAWRKFRCFPSYCNTDIHIEAELLHEQLQSELNHLANIFATSDISTKDVLERLRNMTAYFYMKMYSPYSATEEEMNEVIEQYQMQISIAKNLIEAFRVRKKFLHKTACAKEVEEKSKNGKGRQKADAEQGADFLQHRSAPADPWPRAAAGGAENPYRTPADASAGSGSGSCGHGGALR